jgi:hypothetical protein
MSGFGFQTNFNLSPPKNIFGFQRGVKVILNPSQIFGANLYDWWDFTDTSTQSITSGLIDSITSKGTNAAVFSSSGTERPASIVGINGLNVADFDGVNDFMQVATSTAMYNFLHNGSLGTVIAITKVTYTTEELGGLIINNTPIITTNIGYGLRYDNRTSLGFVKAIYNYILRGVISTSASQNIENNFFDNQYNLIIDKVKANASPVADRSVISKNFGSEIKNNVNTSAPSVANASSNMTIGRNAEATSSYIKGQIPEVIILNSHPTPTQITQLNAYYTNKYGGTFPIV